MTCFEYCNDGSKKMEKVTWHQKNVLSQAANAIAEVDVQGDKEDCGNCYWPANYLCCGKKAATAVVGAVAGGVGAMVETIENAVGIDGMHTEEYRYALFELPGSKHEVVPMFINTEEFPIFKESYMISADHHFQYGKCGESIFLVHHNSNNEIPMKTFCHIYFTDHTVAISNEHVKRLP